MDCLNNKLQLLTYYTKLFCKSINISDANGIFFEYVQCTYYGCAGAECGGRLGIVYIFFVPSSKMAIVHYTLGRLLYGGRCVCVCVCNLLTKLVRFRIW